MVLNLSALHTAMGTILIFSTAYHPQASCHTESVNQILEDILRACAIMYSRSWDICLPFVEFAYKNRYQVSMNMSNSIELVGSKRAQFIWAQSSEEF